MDIKFYTGEEYAKGRLTEMYTDYIQVALKC
jgi:hypothetical protein